MQKVNRNKYISLFSVTKHIFKYPRNTIVIKKLCDELKIKTYKFKYGCRVGNYITLKDFDKIKHMTIFDIKKYVNLNVEDKEGKKLSKIAENKRVRIIKKLSNSIFALDWGINLL